jgi:hypothetical protein
MDPTSARCHHEAGLGILVAQDHLEAAKQLRLDPRIDDLAMLDLDADVEVALDPTDRGDIESLNRRSGHECLWCS